MATPQQPPDFSLFYLQQATKELAEDIDKARSADDFKADSVPFLVHSLQQGASLYSDAERARVMAPPLSTSGGVPSRTPAGDSHDDDVDQGGDRAEDVGQRRSEREKKDKKEKKSRRKSEGRS